MIRLMLWSFLVLGVGYGVALACGMNPSTPTDWVINLPDAPHHEELEAEQPGTLVVLQHGLWRSASSLGRLERALRDHGYDVLNFSYPSTEARIEDHAARLHDEISAHLEAREQPPPRIALVGHSMGGLVVRSYLARDDAVEPWALVFIATPHRGAVLADKRCELAFFDLFMGREAALQLVPGDPLYAGFEPIRCDRVGVIYGGKGDAEGWNDDIPGDDDGTVAVAEAQLGEAIASVGLQLGHTRISFAEETVLQVLTFLRQGRFANPTDR